MFKYVCPSELMMSIKDEEELQTDVRKSIVMNQRQKWFSKPLLIRGS
jgi:hypothetical protein